MSVSSSTSKNNTYRSFFSHKLFKRFSKLYVKPSFKSKDIFINRYKIDPEQPGWLNGSVSKLVGEIIHYGSPLLLLDFTTVKKYPGVDPAEWSKRRSSFIQTPRALPLEAPTVFEIGFQLVGAFILFDLFFCLVHYTLHRNAWLYKNIHAHHHDHNPMTAKVLNQLTMVESVLLVLAGNEALKLVSAHPLTRTIFVPLFLTALTENHCGYDLPWSWDKIVPFGILGGARAHWEHHEKGARHYAPFSTFIDDYVLKSKIFKAI